MPQNLDEHTRGVIVKIVSCSVTLVVSGSLYMQTVVIPQLRARSQKKQTWNGPPLLLGCLASVALMLSASAVFTLPIVIFGRLVEGHSADSIESDRDLSSSINFCEEDFADSAYVAEPANTASSFASYCPLALLGLYGPPSAEWSSHVSGNRRFAVAYITLFAIGIGSAGLHALLTAGAQSGDELPMLWFTASLSFCVMDIIIKGTFQKQVWKSSPNQMWLHWVVFASAVTATSVYVFCRENFLLFYIMFSSYCWTAAVGFGVMCCVLKWNDDVFRSSVLLPLGVCTGWLASLALLSWVAEMLFCSDVTRNFAWGTTIAPWIWNRAVHPLWHCSSALLAWLSIQLLIAGQGLQRGWGEPRLRWYGAPYVIFHKPHVRST